MKINLDGLNPCNTFERRLLEALTNGETLPVNIKLETGKIEERLQALENRPAATLTPPALPADREARIAALEKQSLDLMKSVQLLLQMFEDERRRGSQVRSVLIQLTEQIDTKLKATGT